MGFGWKICPTSPGDVISVWWCPDEDHAGQRCDCSLAWAGHYVATVTDIDAGFITAMFHHKELDGSHFQVKTVVCFQTLLVVLFLFFFELFFLCSLM